MEFLGRLSWVFFACAGLQSGCYLCVDGAFAGVLFSGCLKGCI